jgi:hypothetical protein
MLEWMPGRPVIRSYTAGTLAMRSRSGAILSGRHSGKGRPGTSAHSSSSGIGFSCWHHRRVVVSVDDLDRHADLLAVANGTLDLRTGTLMVPSREVIPSAPPRRSSTWSTRTTSLASTPASWLSLLGASVLSTKHPSLLAPRAQIPVRSSVVRNGSHCLRR